MCFFWGQFSYFAYCSTGSSPGSSPGSSAVFDSSSFGRTNYPVVGYPNLFLPSSSPWQRLLWRSATLPWAQEMLRRLPARVKSKPLRHLVKRLLLAPADSPYDTSPEDKFFVSRLRALWHMGEFDHVLKLLRYKYSAVLLAQQRLLSVPEENPSAVLTIDSLKPEDSSFLFPSEEEVVMAIDASICAGNLSEACTWAQLKAAPLLKEPSSLSNVEQQNKRNKPRTDQKAGQKLEQKPEVKASDVKEQDVKTPEIPGISLPLPNITTRLLTFAELEKYFNRAAAPYIRHCYGFCYGVMGQTRALYWLLDQFRLAYDPPEHRYLEILNCLLSSSPPPEEHKHNMAILERETLYLWDKNLPSPETTHLAQLQLFLRHSPTPTSTTILIAELLAQAELLPLERLVNMYNGITAIASESELIYYNTIKGEPLPPLDPYRIRALLYQLIQKTLEPNLRINLIITLLHHGQAHNCYELMGLICRDAIYSLPLKKEYVKIAPHIIKIAALNHWFDLAVNWYQILQEHDPEVAKKMSPLIHLLRLEGIEQWFQTGREAWLADGEISERLSYFVDLIFTQLEGTRLKPPRDNSVVITPPVQGLVPAPQGMVYIMDEPNMSLDGSALLEQIIAQNHLHETNSPEQYVALVQNLIQMGLVHSARIFAIEALAENPRFIDEIQLSTLLTRSLP